MAPQNNYMIRLIDEHDVTGYADIPSHGHHETFGYPKEIRNDQEPWFLKPIFDKFAEAIDQSSGRYSSYFAAAPIVGGALRNDPSFMSRAETFSDENGWDIRSERLVNLLLLAFKNEAKTTYHHSRHGGAKLRELISKQEKPPCPPEDAGLVLRHLRKVLTERSGVFQSPQDANIAVEASLINAGTTHLKRGEIRKIITWHARVDRKDFATFLPHVSPNANATNKNEFPIETTFTRGRAPTGPIGSSRPSFIGGRGLTKDQKL